MSALSPLPSGLENRVRIRLVFRRESKERPRSDIIDRSGIWSQHDAFIASEVEWRLDQFEPALGVGGKDQARRQRLEWG